MKHDDLLMLIPFMGKECIYVESSTISTVRPIGLRMIGENVQVKFLTTSQFECHFNRVRLNDEEFVRDWCPAPEHTKKSWHISMPLNHVFIRKELKVYFGSTFGMGMRLYFYSDLVALFKKKDVSWWAELEPRSLE